MSGWTTLSIRGLYSRDYEYSEYDERDPYQANADLAVTLQNDDRIAAVGAWKDHVYASLSTGRYDWDTAESVLMDYRNMIYDASVIGANNTTDTGIARYYPVFDYGGNDIISTDTYEERQGIDGCYVGAVAASIMTARHGIIAQESLRFRATGENWDSGVTEGMEERGRDRSTTF